MGGELLMSSKERQRKVEFEGVVEGRTTIREVSGRLRLSYRQCRRRYKRYREEGDRGVVHGSRGRRSNRAKGVGFAGRLWGGTVSVTRGVVRRWRRRNLQEMGMRWTTRRPRKEHCGELVQMDGSHHPWFGEGHPSACLMNMVDDATRERPWR